ncbi:hypothetical protein K439DRAFT_1285921, partial [Ramaria rubella]
ISCYNLEYPGVRVFAQWDTSSEYPGVRVFAQRMKDMVISAHDAIIEACIKQIQQANHCCGKVPFMTRDLVFL